eukprot:8475739-Alexandrium_andersonii.AAC.1
MCVRERQLRRDVRRAAEAKRLLDMGRAPDQGLLRHLWRAASAAGAAQQWSDAAWGVLHQTCKQRLTRYLEGVRGRRIQ